MFKLYQLKMINLFNILHITMHTCRWVTTHVAIPAESQRSHPYLVLLAGESLMGESLKMAICH